MSDLLIDEAEVIQNQIRLEGKIFASKRSSSYLKIRKLYEEKARRIFIEKGGKPKRTAPHYWTLGKCDWFYEWYEETKYIKVPLSEIDKSVVSFTYGDLFPTMNYDDGKPYRKQVYTYDEILLVIDEFGYPQI